MGEGELGTSRNYARIKVQMTHPLYLSMYFHICQTLSVHKGSAFKDCQ